MENRKKQIVVSFSYVDYKDTRRKIAQETVLRVIGNRPSGVFAICFDFPDAIEPPILAECDIYHFPTLKMDSSILLGNTRRLPYIKEILNVCSKIQCDVFGYINSDILVSNAVWNILQSDFDAFIFSRTDIGEVDFDGFIKGNFRAIYGGDSHCGVDGFFFKKSWWNENKNKFPDGLLLGTTEWDTCYRHIIKNIKCNYFEKRMLYHVYHDQVWTTTSASAINNIAIWNEIKKRYN